MPTAAITYAADPAAFASRCDPGATLDLKCQTCAYVRTSTTNAARVAGWRVYSGPTLGGTVVDVVLCPPCLAGKPAPYRAECLTCGESSDDDEALDEKGASRWKFDHECEPDVVVRRIDRPEET